MRCHVLYTVEKELLEFIFLRGGPGEKTKSVTQDSKNLK